MCLHLNFYSSLTYYSTFEALYKQAEQTDLTFIDEAQYVTQWFVKSLARRNDVINTIWKKPTSIKAKTSQNHHTETKQVKDIGDMPSSLDKGHSIGPNVIFNLG